MIRHRPESKLRSLCFAAIEMVEDVRVLLVGVLGTRFALRPSRVGVAGAVCFEEEATGADTTRFLAMVRDS